MSAQSCRARLAEHCRDSQWGRVLASYVAQLSPEFVVQAPLPQGVLIDQLGALLALTASELSGRVPKIREKIGLRAMSPNSSRL